MTDFLVDSSVLLDLLTADPAWAGWSHDQLDVALPLGRIVLTPIVYAEIALAFARVEALDRTVDDMRLEFEEMPRPALFLAARVAETYRRQGGRQSAMLPDFLIGAHAAICGYTLITRDRRRRRYFPRLATIMPPS